MLVIPDFTKQLNLEGKMLDLKDLNMLLTVQDAGCCGCLIPSKYKD